MNTIRVAVYGTLRQGDTRAGVMGDNKVFEGRINGFKMFHLGGFPAVEPAALEHQITVEVYEVDEITLRRCDGIEGHPTFYKREVIGTPAGDAYIYMIRGIEQSDRNPPRIDSGDWRDQDGPVQSVS